MAPDSGSEELQVLIGQALQACRVAAELSREELAERLGVSPARIAEYELGTVELEAAVLWRASLVTGVSIDGFYTALKALLGQQEPVRKPPRPAADPPGAVQGERRPAP